MADERISILTESNQLFHIAVTMTEGGRAEMQDRFGCLLKNNSCIAVVCDGMGGSQCGEIAAESALDIVLKKYDDNNSLKPEELLENAVDEANLAVSSMTGPDGEKIYSGSTITAVIIDDNQLYWCSVGDSRAYIIRDNEYARLTYDHTYSAVLEKKLAAGQITEEIYIEEMKRGAILISYLGMGSEILKDYNKKPISLLPGDRILLMSDGLYKILEDDEIIRIINSSNSTEKALERIEESVQLEAQVSGKVRDNMTAAIVEVR